MSNDSTSKTPETHPALSEERRASIVAHQAAPPGYATEPEFNAALSVEYRAAASAIQRIFDAPYRFSGGPISQVIPQQVEALESLLALAKTALEASTFDPSTLTHVLADEAGQRATIRTLATWVQRALWLRWYPEHLGKPGGTQQALGEAEWIAREGLPRLPGYRKAVPVDDIVQLVGKWAVGEWPAGAKPRLNQLSLTGIVSKLGEASGILAHHKNPLNSVDNALRAAGIENVASMNATPDGSIPGRSFAIIAKRLSYEQPRGSSTDAVE